MLSLNILTYEFISNCMGFSFLTLFEKNAKLGEEILEDSINLLEQFDKDLIIVQKALKKNNKDNTVKLRVKKKVHTRITGL